MSNIGSKCVRKLWLEKNNQDKVEKLRPSDKFKFLYGDLLESLLLFIIEYLETCSLTCSFVVNTNP